MEALGIYGTYLTTPMYFWVMTCVLTRGYNIPPRKGTTQESPGRDWVSNPDSEKRQNLFSIHQLLNIGCSALFDQVAFLKGSATIACKVLPRVRKERMREEGC